MKELMLEMSYCQRLIEEVGENPVEIGNIYFSDETDEEVQCPLGEYKLVKKRKDGTCILKNLDSGAEVKIEEDYLEMFRVAGSDAVDKIMKDWMESEIEDGCFKGRFSNMVERFRNTHPGLYKEENWTKRIVSNIEKIVDARPVKQHPGSDILCDDIVHPLLTLRKLDQESKNSLIGHDLFGREFEKANYSWVPVDVLVDKDRVPKFIGPVPMVTKAEFKDTVEDLEMILALIINPLEEVLDYCQYLSYTDNYADYDLPRNPSKCSLANRKIQIVPKIVEMTFKPDQEYEGLWHWNGMPHERIIATCLLFIQRDVGLQGGNLMFKRPFSDHEVFHISQNITQQNWTMQYATDDGFLPIGYAETSEGTVLVFPNCHLHKLKKIHNPTDKELKTKFIAFFLVDPMHPVPSTTDYPGLAEPSMHADEYQLESIEERRCFKSTMNPRPLILCMD